MRLNQPINVNSLFKYFQSHQQIKPRSHVSIDNDTKGQANLAQFKQTISV